MPKADLDAEAAVISTCLLDPSKCDEAFAMLSPADFYADANARIFEAIRIIAMDNREVDLVSVASVLREQGRIDQIGGTPYLAQLCNATPAVAHIKTHCRLVLDCARIRRAGHIAHRFAAEAYGSIANPQEWLQRFEAAAYEAAADVTVTESSGMYGECAKEAFDVIREAAASKAAMIGWPTGFAEIDNHTGGWCDGDFWVVAGRPAMGKTSWVMQAAENVANAPDPEGNKGIVVVFSLEMKRKQLLLRALSRLAQVPNMNLRRGRLLPDQWNSLIDATKAQYVVPIMVDDSRDLTPYRLRSKIRRHVATLRAKFGQHLKLRAVVIDYLQLMAGNGDASTRAEEIAGISRDMKKAAGELNCALVALSSLNRPEKSQKSKPPDMGDIRESGAVEFDADVIMMVHRMDEYKEKHEIKDNLADLIFAKARNSGNANFTVQFDGRFTAFSPLGSDLLPRDSQDYGDHWSDT